VFHILLTGICPLAVSITEKQVMSPRAKESGLEERMSVTVSIHVRNVSKIFGSGTEQQVTALNDVSVSIAQNEFFTLLGPSGCGKTTLLRLIAGFEHPTQGSILLEGTEISALPPFQRPINTVFQSYALFPHMSVSQNIGFGLEMQGRPKDEVADTVRNMLNLVKMESLKDRRIDQISGGQQQRVALARALAPRPKVLLLDEPLSALDLKLRKEMQVELKRLQHETGITFIFVTHDQEEALTMSNRVAVMNEGQILQIGAPHEIYNRPNDRFVADFIGDTNFISADVIDRQKSEVRVRLSGGGEMTLPAPEDLPQGNAVTLAIRPEQARIAAADDPVAMQGTLEDEIYIGTDTQYRIDIGATSPFVVRVQNADGGTRRITPQSQVGICIDPSRIRILKD